MSVHLTDVSRSNPRQGRKPKKGHPWGAPDPRSSPPRPVHQDVSTFQAQHIIGTTGCYHSHVPSSHDD